ncbi:phosphatidylglycerol lysyltransferase [Enterococcus saigonensis]|uniref:Phosphatidylglycerol lysyltransferase n=1 Tax=Enterococcus saigonensis TaxID=1805431 RepID=A0A679INT4_9ENTE|nr:bifunctional lysylphosphatidylglycerol flippase/synthetase MprF [Enterococcus saigonensis]BCA85474.1 phosphatidylglycerol lysyltransferase [Enterococcus saigonensis]
MQKLIAKLKGYESIFKMIFLFAVIVIVAGELISISKTINVEQLKTTLIDVPIYKVFLMFVIGLIAVLPMVGYDFTLNKMLNLEHKKSYIFETSWLINTINNIAGFGGFVSIGLRSEFFGKGKKGKDVVSALSKILIFLMSGLSIYSLISFFLVMFTDINPYLQQYWIWLIGGGLYFPAILLITHFKKSGLLGGLKPRFRIELIVSSFLEWTGVAGSFLAIGYLMEVPFPLWQVLPLYIAASVIGIVSMIPGALGSFDIMMILGLSNLGINRETVIAWLLLYRIFYYLIPFAIGLVLFFKNLWTRIDTRYSGIPKQLTLEIFHKIEVAMLYFSGIMMVLMATVPQAFSEFKWLQHVNPFRFHIIVQFPSIVLGFSLLIMGRAIASRVKRAYFPTIILIVAAIIYTILIDFSLVAITFLSLILLITLLSKTELFREQLVYSWEQLTIDGIIIGGLTLLYLVIGIYNLPTFPHHHRKTISFFLFPSEKLWFSGFIAILVITLFILLFVRYLQGKKKQPGEIFNEAKVSHILNTYGGNSDSQLVYLKDKNIFVYNDGADDTVFLQFATYNNKNVVMGSPNGKKADFEAAIAQFIHEADVLGYLPVFYETDEDTVMILHELGYDFIKMGEEALVELDTFTTSGKKMKGTRAVLNKIEKNGFNFEILQPPYSADEMTTFKEISDSWLDGRKEKGFSLGFFDEDYLQRGPMAVVKNSEGEIVSFANIIPTYTKEIGTIDLMRHHADKAPSGSMDFLFVNLFSYMQENGIQYFDLGMAPLSNVGQSRKSFIQERIAYLVYEFGSRFYSFQGLRDYKEKYASQWRSRYTLYSRDSWIAYVMLAILFIDNRSIDKKKTLHGVKRFLKH